MNLDTTSTPVDETVLASSPSPTPISSATHEGVLRNAVPEELDRPRWPKVAPIAGEVYGFTCPATGADMVGMSRGTMLALGNTMEMQQRTLAAQDSRIKELLAELAGINASYDSLQKKHSNLREATRQKRLEEIEKPKIAVVRKPVPKATGRGRR